MTDNSPHLPIGCGGGEVAAHALGALPADDERSFREHLATCSVCRDELAAFEQVIEALAMSVPHDPAPASLRSRVLAEVQREETSRARAARRPRSLSLAWPTRPAAAVCAVVVTALAIFGATRLNPGHSARARVVDARVIGSAGSAHIAFASGRGELIVHHLPPPPSGEVYEVWLTRPGQRPRATSVLFNVTGAGDADLGIPADLSGVKQIMVTPEPAGGTERPTHPAVITADLL